MLLQSGMEPFKPRQNQDRLEGDLRTAVSGNRCAVREYVPSIQDQTMEGGHAVTCYEMLTIPCESTNSHKRVFRY